jgi:hypothetical protein
MLALSLVCHHLVKERKVEAVEKNQKTDGGGPGYSADTPGYVVGGKTTLL